MENKVKFYFVLVLFKRKATLCRKNNESLKNSARRFSENKITLIDLFLIFGRNEAHLSCSCICLLICRRSFVSFIKRLFGIFMYVIIAALQERVVAARVQSVRYYFVFMMWMGVAYLSVAKTSKPLIRPYWGSTLVQLVRWSPKQPRLDVLINISF